VARLGLQTGIGRTTMVSCAAVYFSVTLSTEEHTRQY